MWYFSLSPQKAALTVACLGGRARFFLWRSPSLWILPKREEENALRKDLAALGIFPEEKSYI